ncbi:unnamed protein product [Moneuplotes crassus]|uniref:Uncharacterized protein n=1 Tax=Euplotes crassus TaxID=5936 RepID=A0AAD2DA86_EUPCR|nr:unnamed protein product [Moneuplotes crassus]
MYTLPSKDSSQLHRPTFSITSPALKPHFLYQIKNTKSAPGQVDVMQAKKDLSKKIIKERRQSRETPKFPHKKSTVRKSLSLLAKKAYRVHRKALPPIITKEGLKNYKRHLYSLDSDFEEFLQKGHVSALKDINKSFNPYNNAESLACNQAYQGNENKSVAVYSMWCDNKLKIHQTPPNTRNLKPQGLEMTQHFDKMTKFGKNTISGYEDKLESSSNNPLFRNSKAIKPSKRVKLSRTLSTVKNLRAFKNQDFSDFPSIYREETTRSTVSNSKTTQKLNHKLSRNLDIQEVYRGGNKSRATSSAKTCANITNTSSDYMKQCEKQIPYSNLVTSTRLSTRSQV